MKAWDDFLLFLEGKFGKQTTDTWVRSLKIVRFDACNLHLEANDSFQLTWYQEHVAPLAKQHLLDHNKHPIKLSIQCSDTTRKEEEAPPTFMPPISFESDLIHPHATFDQYVASANQNSFVIFCKLLGFDPLTGLKGQFFPDKFNPIYLYGPSGIGKSHLLMAASSFLQSQGLRVFYVKADTFTEHVVYAIRNGQMQRFRQTYRKLDVLIIDDIEVLGRKNATQEEFFHTFNTLHTAGKQIILSASVNPRLLEYIEERLISRFEWGLTLPFEKETSSDLLLSLIKKRSTFYQLHLKKNLTDYLLRYFPTPAALSRSLESIARKGEPLELHQIEPLLTRLIEREQLSSLSSEKILSYVAEVFGIKKEDILSSSQARDVSLPRQISMYLLRKELNLPYMKIGDLFHRDHSTVMSNIKQITKSLQSQNPDITHYLNQLKALLSKTPSS